jgi:hypothetical protein
MHWLPDWARNRYRAGFLLLTGLTAAAYGAGIIAATVTSNLPPWLPESSRKISELSPQVWGILWAAVGVLLLGLFWWRPAERYLFAAASVINAGWAASFLIGYVRFGHAGYWAPGIAFAGVAAAILLVSSWPDPPARQ